VSGEGALRILAAALARPRKGGEEEAVVAKGRYEEFVRSKRGRKESKARKEVFIDLCCSAVSAVAVLSFIAAVVLRYIGDLSMYVDGQKNWRVLPPCVSGYLSSFHLVSGIRRRSNLTKIFY
jgi:hypothetical protein